MTGITYPIKDEWTVIVSMTWISAVRMRIVDNGSKFLWPTLSGIGKREIDTVKPRFFIPEDQDYWSATIVLVFQNLSRREPLGSTIVAETETGLISIHLLREAYNIERIIFTCSFDVILANLIPQINKLGVSIKGLD